MIRKIMLVAFILVIVCVSGKYYFIPYLYPTKYYVHFEKYAKIYKLDVEFVLAVARTESHFDSTAVSSKDARGLMQIMPATAEWAAQKIGIKDFKIENLFDPATNIQIGCWYLGYLNDRFDGTELALAAYNAGTGNVNKWLENVKYSKNGVTLYNIPFKETEGFIKKINRDTKIYSLLLKYKLHE